MFVTTPEKLLVLLKSGALQKDNHEACVRLFYDAAKVIYYRQERLNKPRLRMNQVASLLQLVYFYHCSMYQFESIGDLACNFGSCPEDQAVAYFENTVVGKVTDSFGRSIAIENAGRRSLYKDLMGKHVVAPVNYEEVRGKRLPWIRHVIENAKSVFRADENVGGTFRRTFLYTAISSVPWQGKKLTGYFVVVVSEDANRNLRFVTAYQVAKHNQFLSRIEPCLPFFGK